MPKVNDYIGRDVQLAQMLYRCPTNKVFLKDGDLKALADKGYGDYDLWDALKEKYGPAFTCGRADLMTGGYRKSRKNRNRNRNKSRKNRNNSRRNHR